MEATTLYQTATALKRFCEHARREVARVKRNLNGLSQDDLASLIRSPEEQVRDMEEGVATNTAFLDQLLVLIQERPVDEASLASPSRAVTGATAPSSKSVETLLRNLTRDWSEEGRSERRDCHDRLMNALELHLGGKRGEAADKKPVVLFPGTQLGRLPFEVARLGYECEACEASPLNFFAIELLRKRGGSKESLVMQPFVLNTCNRFKALDHVRRIAVPDVEIGSMPRVLFGEFSQLYGTSAALATADAVLTAFALDCSPNVIRFVRTIAHVVRPGGLWANFGPLAYTEHDEAHSQGVELSWAELKHAISHFFTFQQDAEFVDAFHSSNQLSMMQLQLSCVYFSAVRNDKPAEGIGDR